MAMGFVTANGQKAIYTNMYEMTLAFRGVAGICMRCNEISERGYLICVLGDYMCPECAEDWEKRAGKPHKQDIPFMDAKYNEWKAEFERIGKWDEQGEVKTCQEH